jgi:hypothetical protein
LEMEKRQKTNASDNDKWQTAKTNKWGKNTHFHNLQVKICVLKDKDWRLWRPLNQTYMLPRKKGVWKENHGWTMNFLWSFNFLINNFNWQYPVHVIKIFRCMQYVCRFN